MLATGSETDGRINKAVDSFLRAGSGLIAKITTSPLSAFVLTGPTFRTADGKVENHMQMLQANVECNMIVVVFQGEAKAYAAYDITINVHSLTDLSGSNEKQTDTAGDSGTGYSDYDSERDESDSDPDDSPKIGEWKLPTPPPAKVPHEFDYVYRKYFDEDQKHNEDKDDQDAAKAAESADRASREVDDVGLRLALEKAYEVLVAMQTQLTPEERTARTVRNYERAAIGAAATGALAAGAYYGHREYRRRQRQPANQPANEPSEVTGGNAEATTLKANTILNASM